MGKQEANIYEIAREAGVSIATVSRVINHSNAVSEKSYRRVMDAVRKFNYVPNSTARSLSTSTSTSIGVVIPDINNPFFSLLLEGITRVADERGYHVLLFNTAENTDREHQVLQTMREHRLRGIIITPVSEQDPDTMKRLHNFETLGIPVVLLDREVDSQFFDRVVTDDERGVHAAASPSSPVPRPRAPAASACAATTARCGSTACPSHRLISARATSWSTVPMSRRWRCAPCRSRPRRCSLPTI